MPEPVRTEEVLGEPSKDTQLMNIASRFGALGG
jgi:hypothetical protein